MKLSDYLFSRLEKEGIKEVFQVYGAATGHLVDAFVRVEGIDYVAPFHEQACGFAAEGYAKISGKIGVALAKSSNMCRELFLRFCTLFIYHRSNQTRIYAP